MTRENTGQEYHDKREHRPGVSSQQRTQARSITTTENTGQEYHDKREHRPGVS